MYNLVLVFVSNLKSAFVRNIFPLPSHMGLRTYFTAYEISDFCARQSVVYFQKYLFVPFLLFKGLVLKCFLPFSTVLGNSILGDLVS